MYSFVCALLIFSLFAAFSTDSEVGAQVRNAIQNNHDISSYGRSVQVSINEGVVTLTGQVKGEKEKHKIVKIAKKTKGVTDVVDKMTTTFKD